MRSWQLHLLGSWTLPSQRPHSANHASSRAQPKPTRMPEPDVAQIRALNDRARQSFTGCRVVITRGVAELGDDTVQAILAQVRSYDHFTPDNDPFEEHDFGSFQYGDVQVFWRWDYYDLDLHMHSPDPADETVTARVLTVMLAEEY
jgi:Protein of unknown function (DUF3768).